MPEDITKDPEYIRGYEDSIASYQKMEERQKTAYAQGSYAAFRDLMQNGKDGSILQDAIRIEKDTESLLEGLVLPSQEQSETLTILEKLKQFREDMKKFDERLRRLEKYTEE